MIAAVTELHLRSIWVFPRFLWHAARSKKQAERSVGVLSVRVTSDGFRIQRTLTLWEDEKSMWAFVRSNPHRKAMKTTGQLSRITRTTHFAVDQPPTWNEALERLRVEGH